MALLERGNLSSRIKRVKLILSDVDGVLTDGKIRLLDEDKEIKVFSSRDAATLVRLAKEAGVAVALITGRDSKAIRRRTQELKADFLLKKEVAGNFREYF